MREDAKFHVWLLSGYCSGYSVATVVGLNHKEGHVHLHIFFCTTVTVATQWPHNGHTVATGKTCMYDEAFLVAFTKSPRFTSGHCVAIVWPLCGHCHSCTKKCVQVHMAFFMV